MRTANVSTRNSQSWKPFQTVETPGLNRECQAVIDAGFALPEELTERLDADGERFDKEPVELEALLNG